jgi:hypothetical protein
MCGSGYRIGYSDALRDGRSGNRIPVGARFLCPCPDQPFWPHSVLYNEYRISLPAVKQPELGVNHSLSSSAEVKERVELYFYSPAGP